MSNPLAIAGVTATLRRRLLDAGIGNISTLPPDKAASPTLPTERINLFLYDLVPNAAWRNRDMPGQVKPGETGFPPLALNLYYLLTAYGDDGPSLLDHRLLGRAMAMFHDSAILSPQDMVEATADIQDPFLATSPDLHRQIDRVRITPHTLSVEDKSRLWGTFQTQYRVSVAYEVSVVLIDSTRPMKTTLPVMKRGWEDPKNWEPTAHLGPLLESLQYHDSFKNPRIRLSSTSFPRTGEKPLTVTLKGTNLTPLAGRKLLIRDPRSSDEVLARLELRTKPGTKRWERGEKGEEEVQFDIDPNLSDARWRAGQLTAAIESTLRFGGDENEKRPRISPALSFALAPRLRLNTVGTVLALPSQEDQRTLLTVGCDPPLATDDGVFLLLDPLSASGGSAGAGAMSRQLSLRRESASHSSSTPTFDATDLTPGTYRVRLRVDGIDSHLVMTAGGSPDFDPSQQLTVT